MGGSAGSALRVLLPLLLCCPAAAKGGALTVLGGAIESAAAVDTPRGWRQLEGGSWLRTPRSAFPWGAVHFIGGAALGAAPQLVYDRLLTEIAERAQVAVIATPYTPEQDHNRLAQQVKRSFEDACAACEAEGLGPWPVERVVRLGHSLGGKLCAILSCEGGGERVGTLAFNNFGVEDSIAIATDILQRLGGAGSRDKEVADAIRTAFSFAQAFGRAQGVSVDFVPSPDELNLRIAESYSAAETAVWNFEEDTLDSSPQFLAALPTSALRTAATLPGPHTAPVLLQLSGADLGAPLGAIFGDRTLSLGDEELVEQIAEEVAAWVWPSGVRRAKMPVLPPSEQTSAAP